MSQITCPHCESTNNLKTAGQLYCADCGQLIDDKPPKAVAHKAPIVKSKSTVKPKPSAPPLNLKAIEEARTGKTATTAKPKPGVLDLKNAQPKAPAKKTIGRHVPPKPVTEPTPVIAEADLSDAPAVIKVPIQRKFHHKLAIRDGLKSITTGKAFVTAFTASIVATVAEVGFMRWFSTSGSYAIQQSLNNRVINQARLQTLIDHAGWALLLGFAGYLVYHYALADIIFRTSRTFDRRSATTAQCRRAALGSLAGLFGVDVITWTLALILLSLVAAANIGFIGTKSLGLAGMALAILTNIVAMYVALGLVAARHMATYAIVLGQVGLRRAYSTGWSLFTRQFGRLTNGLILISLVSMVLALPAGLASKLTTVQSTLGFALVVAVTALTQALILIIGSVYFLRLYRFLISQEYDSDLGHLLSGRQPRKSHVARRLAVLGLVSLLVTAISVSFIAMAPQLAQSLIR